MWGCIKQRSSLSSSFWNDEELHLIKAFLLVGTLQDYWDVIGVILWNRTNKVSLPSKTTKEIMRFPPSWRLLTLIIFWWPYLQIPLRYDFGDYVSKEWISINIQTIADSKPKTKTQILTWAKNIFSSFFSLGFIKEQTFLYWFAYDHLKVK